jgi:hypothetical protein
LFCFVEHDSPNEHAISPCPSPLSMHFRMSNFVSNQCVCGLTFYYHYHRYCYTLFSSHFYKVYLFVTSCILRNCLKMCNTRFTVWQYKLAQWNKVTVVSLGWKHRS